MAENNPQTNNTSGEVKTIHTYLTDMAETVRDNEISVIKIALAEQNKHEKEDLYKKAEGTSLTKTLLILGGIILIAGSMAGVYFVMQKNKAINAPVVIQDTNTNTIISSDNQAKIDVTSVISNSDLVSLIKTEAEKVEKPGSIKNIILEKTTGTNSEALITADMFSTMNLTAPSSLIRSLGDQYMIGTYTPTESSVNTKPHLFMLLQVNDYNLVYAGMLQWEKSMLNDFYGYYGVDISGDRSALLQKEFKDIILNNKDARILYDNFGTEILYYIFVDKNNLIITDSQDTIKEISARILTNKTQPL